MRLASFFEGVIFALKIAKNYTKSHFCVIFDDFLKENYTSAVEMRKDKAGRPGNARQKGARENKTRTKQSEPHQIVRPAMKTQKY